jgi:hypothetical protein
MNTVSRVRRFAAITILTAVFAAAPLALTAQNGTGWKLEIVTAAAQEQASDAAEKEAFEAAKSLDTVEGWQAFLKNFPTGFRADLAKAYLSKLNAATATPAPPSTPAAPAPAAAAADMVTLTPVAVPVGQWPERAAFDGRSLWVSESGARSIAEINLQTRNIKRRLKVGRLPVDMVATENGTVYALAETDNMIYAVAQGGGAGEFAQVPRCADILDYADNNLWVISNLDCSAPSVLTRVSHLNGRSSKVADLLGGPVDMEAAHGFVYIGHMTHAGRPAFVSIVNAATGDAMASPDLPIHYPRMAANSSAVYAAGAPLDQQTGMVLKIDAGKAEFSARQSLPEEIAAIAANDQYVVAAGKRGTIFVLSAQDLSPVRTISTGTPMLPHDVVVAGNTLAVVSFSEADASMANAVYLIDGWLPGSAPVPYVAPPPPVTQPVATTPQVRPQAVQVNCARGYKKVRGECVMLQNCGRNAYRSPEGDCYCNKGFDMVSGKCVYRKKKPVRDNCPGDSVLKNGRCVKEEEPDFKPPVKCTGGQLYSLSQQRCACQDGLKWNGQRCYLP